MWFDVFSELLNKDWSYCSMLYIIAISSLYWVVMKYEVWNMILPATGGQAGCDSNHQQTGSTNKNENQNNPPRKEQLNQFLPFWKAGLSAFGLLRLLIAGRQKVPGTTLDSQLYVVYPVGHRQLVRQNGIPPWPFRANHAIHHRGR